MVLWALAFYLGVLGACCWVLSVLLVVVFAVLLVSGVRGVVVSAVGVGGC
jgi:hypothetical protein